MSALSFSERQAAAICELVQLFPSSVLLPGLSGEIRALHGEKCGWCEYDYAELRALREDWQHSLSPAERDREYADWLALPIKARRRALEKALGRAAL